MTSSDEQFNPELDLVLERVVDVPARLIWEAWTKPEHIMKWFAPAPWKVTECVIDLRPGGIFRTAMQSPEGETYPGADGCFLEVVPQKRLTFTDALGPGYRPSPEPFFTAVVTIEDLGPNQTRYIAKAMHRDPEGRAKHEAMGFHVGWGICFDQLVELAKGWMR